MRREPSSPTPPDSPRPTTRWMGRSLSLGLLALPALSLTVMAAARLPRPAPPATSVKASKSVRLAFTDLNGRAYTSQDLARNRASVFLFMGTECPISNAYTPRILALANAFRAKGVRVFGVYSNRNESLEQVRKHVRERGFPFPLVKDEDGALARQLGAKITPEAVALDASGAVRYRGRIDDSKASEKVDRHDLRDALNALVAGKPVARPVTAAFGCAIAGIKSLPLNSILDRPSGGAGPKITFAKDVAPILQQNCQSCHRPGEVGPMALTTYEQASAFAGAIKTVTQKRTMPPWHAAEDYGDIQHARQLTDAQIKTLAQWADSGAPKGDPKDMPAPPTFPAGWQLGQPDTVYQSPEPYQVAADGADVYRNYVLPTGFDEDMYVTGMEVRPDKKQIVHHVIAYIDARPGYPGRSLELDRKDPGPGYTSSGAGINFDPDGMIGGWAPGNEPRFLPEGLAVKLPKGSRIVLQVHYHKNGVALEDRTRLGIHFAKTTVKKLAMPYPVLNPGLEIPPGAKDHRVTAEATAPLDVHAFAIMPHMHTLGQRMRVTATKPDGSKVPLVYVPKWDFNWQNTYFYNNPVALPKGSKVLVEADYDNSAENPNNPNKPPKTVRWGEATTDEMLLAYVWVTVDAENLSIPPKVGKPDQVSAAR